MSDTAASRRAARRRRVVTQDVGRRELARRLEGWRDADAGPMYERLAAGIRAALMDGRIPAASRLPAERELSEELQVSRTTVRAAYARLRETGFLVSRQGSGSRTSVPAARSGPPRVLLPGQDTAPGVIDLAVAAPVPDAEVLERAARSAEPKVAAYLADLAVTGDHGYYSAGLPQLRQAIADRYTMRGLPTGPCEIFVTTGGQGAIDLVVRQLAGPRDLVLVESPTYPNALEALRRTGTRMVPLPVPCDPERLLETIRTTRPTVAYLVPDFHNPTGGGLDAEVRPKLVRTARETGTTLIIDEVAAELPLDGQEMPPPVAAFDPDGTVVTVGSMSKTFWGGLRIGWVRAAPPLLDELTVVRTSVDLSGPVLGQIMAVDLLADADAAIARRCAGLAAQRDALEALLREHLPSWTWEHPRGGLCLWVRLDAPMSSALTEEAARRDLRIVAGPRFGLDGVFERWLRLPYTRPVPELREAVGRLAEAHAALRTSAPTLRRSPVVA